MSLGIDTRRSILSAAIAGALALVATLGGSWGEVAGQTAGPPPANDGSAPEVAPPPALEYRPDPTPASTAPPTLAAATATSPGPSTPAAAAAGPSPPTRSRTAPGLTPAATPLVLAPHSATSAKPDSALPAPASNLAISTGGAIAGAVVVLAALALGAWWYRRRRHQ